MNALNDQVTGRDSRRPPERPRRGRGPRGGHLRRREGLRRRRGHKEMAEAGTPRWSGRSGRLQVARTCGRGSASRWSPRSPATPSAAAASWRCAADLRVAGERPGSASPRSCSGSSPARVAPSGCPAWSARPRPRTSSSPAAWSAPPRRWQIGLVDQVVPDDDVYSAGAGPGDARTPAARRSPCARPRRPSTRGLEVDLATGLAIERVQFAALFGTEDQRAGMAASSSTAPARPPSPAD